MLEVFDTGQVKSESCDDRDDVSPRTGWSRDMNNNNNYKAINIKSTYRGSERNFGFIERHKTVYYKLHTSCY